MGLDVLLSKTETLRRALNILSVLEEKKTEGNYIGTTKILEEYEKKFKSKKYERTQIDRELERIMDWKEDYMIDIVRKSPYNSYKFNLTTDDSELDDNKKFLNNNAYLELLKIVFGLIIITGEDLSFLNEFLIKKENPLNFLSTLLESISSRNKIKLEYKVNRKLYTKEVYFKKVEYKRAWQFIFEDNDNLITLSPSQITSVNII